MASFVPRDVDVPDDVRHELLFVRSVERVDARVHVVLVEDPNATVGDTDASAGPPGELLSKRIIFFDFDRSDIRADSQSIVAAHAAYLAKNPAQKVRLEGHADERGSREYNIGLGERRGQAVRRALALQGVAETQLSTVSYGEERPAAAGSDEQAYGLNRRVEIVYMK